MTTPHTTPLDPMVAVTVLGNEVCHELRRAMHKFGPMASAHEGISVIREEFEELWEHVKADTGSSTDARVEAIQLAAMALRYAFDVCDRVGSES